MLWVVDINMFTRLAVEDDDVLKRNLRNDKLPWNQKVRKTWDSNGCGIYAIQMLTGKSEGEVWKYFKKYWRWQQILGGMEEGVKDGDVVNVVKDMGFHAHPRVEFFNQKTLKVMEQLAEESEKSFLVFFHDHIISIRKGKIFDTTPNSWRPIVAQVWEIS
jgi:hypothetical protein